MRFGRTRKRCGKTGASAGSATGGGEIGAQDDYVQGGDVQRMAVSPLGELRPRPS
jgi:hypothetical protein